MDKMLQRQKDMKSLLGLDEYSAWVERYRPILMKVANGGNILPAALSVAQELTKEGREVAAQMVVCTAIEIISDRSGHESHP
jgi:hypothetical protein